MSTAQFLFNAFSILLIDLLLAGDNALVIALAVRRLHGRERRIGSVLGAALAVLMRVALTFVAAKIIDLEYIQLAGGIFIAWIALKVLIDVSSPPEKLAAPGSLFPAIWQIAIADLTMSTDNILAIAGASKGHLVLIIFGLGLSIPFVILSANLLSSLMDRFPILIYLGSAVLGYVAGDMIMSDRFIQRTLHPSDLTRYIVEGALVLALLVVGRIICSARRCE